MRLLLFIFQERVLRSFTDIEQFKITQGEIFQRGREHGSNEEIRYCEDYIRYHMTLVFSRRKELAGG